MILRIWQLIPRTISIWIGANASRMSAALTYYTVLSLAPILMIAIAIAGYVYDDHLAEHEILKQVNAFTTPEIAKTVSNLIQNAVRPESGIVAGSISLCILVFAASGVFTQLYDTFNDIWEVSHEDKNGFLLELQKRLIGIGMVFLMGVLLITSLIINSAFTYLSSLVDGSYPVLVGWLSFADRGFSFLLMPLVFTMMFWFLPATKIRATDALPAGFLTACLFAGSRYLIGLYLEFSTTSEVYGAAGSLVILLIWVYITGMVVFLGASFSRAWAITFGSRTIPNSDNSEVAQTEIGDVTEPSDSAADGQSNSSNSSGPSPSPPLVPTRRV
ncbi:MAG: YihY/virulence factor BrkB family protein [Planctomycetota bacterium]